MQIGISGRGEMQSNQRSVEGHGQEVIEHHRCVKHGERADAQLGGQRYAIVCGVGPTAGDCAHECDAEKFQCMAQREPDENAWADGNG